MDGSMLNYLWGCMILIGVVYAALTGNIDSVTSGALDGAKDAVSLCITMLGVMAFWCGLMEIAEKSGLIDKCKCGVAPLISWLFPNVPRQSRAFSYLTFLALAGRQLRREYVPCRNCQSLMDTTALQAVICVHFW